MNYLRELLRIYEHHGIDTAFWFTFASWNRPHRQDPRKDLDIASFGVVKVTSEQSPTAIQQWSRKAIFHEFAKIAGDH